VNSKPIGVFDSGIGGLTVLKEIVRLMPAENTVYLGDTARVPYGTKSKETVSRYALEDARFLLTREVKLVVTACNTASAYAIPELKREIPVPVIGVIEPGARAAIEATRNNKIGIIGTEGTVKSRAYSKTIQAMRPAVETFEKACPLFVPLVEEGFSHDEVTDLVASRYLKELKAAGIDTLVLGCTHYPLLKETISGFMGEGITLIDSAESTAAEIRGLLAEMGLSNDTDRTSHSFYVTDSPERFSRVGRLFFGERLNGPELVHVEAN